LLTLKIYDSYHNLPDVWHKSIPLQHPLHSNELRIIEDEELKNIQPLYVIIYKNEQALLLLYAQVLKFSPAYIHHPNFNTPLRALAKVTLNCTSLKLLVVGHLFRHDHAFAYFLDGVKDQQNLFAQSINLLTKKVRHTAILLKDLPDNLALPFAYNTKYKRFENDVSMQLQIKPEWASMQDYETALKKKYAKRYRSTVAQFSQVVEKEFNHSDIIKYSNDIYELYLQVAKNQTITFGLLNKNYFAAFKQALGNSLKVYGYFLDDKLVAFSTAILKNNTYDMNYIGFDYKTNESHSIYFNLLFRFISHALQYKCTLLSMGRTALEAKAIIGCKPKVINGFYSIKNPLFNFLTTKFSSGNAINQGDMWLKRHPFKDELE
jgi:hypothetical protein